MPSKYGPLTTYLAAQSDDRVELSLPEIETIIGAPLLRYAWGPDFWSNNPRRPGPLSAWRDVGWRVVGRVYRPPTWVITFVREGAAGGSGGGVVACRYAAHVLV